MDRYQTFSPRHMGSFSERLAELYMELGLYLEDEKAEGRTLRHCKVFLSDIRNQLPQLQASSLYRHCLSATALSVIGQPPLSGAKITLLVKTSDEPERTQLLSLRLSAEEAKGLDAYGQTLLLFQRYLQYAEERDLTLRTHLMRTWIYVSDIDSNYAGMVKARNEVFALHGLTPETHFVASTGIGGDAEAPEAKVAIDFLTYPDVSERDKLYLQAPTHLNPTHEYGVAFERATRLSLPGKQVFYVSGTASIDHRGRVVYEGDVARQTARLLENIGELLKAGGATMVDVKYFIVYLRDLSDNDVVNLLMEQAFPGVPRVMTLAKVCRPKWLVEMECVAEKYEE